MASRRSRSRHISDDQIVDLVSLLHELVPEIQSQRRPHSHKVSTSKVLEETCSYIRNLHKEADDLSHRLSDLLDSMDRDSAQAAIVRSLLPPGV